MNNSNFNNILRFTFLVLFQVLIFNNINFMGYVNPYPYILFVLLFPVNNNRSLFIFLSFLIGLTVDLFSDSGGVHAASCAFIAYIRPPVLKFSFGMLYEHHTMKFSNTDFSNKFVYFLILTVFHHLMLFTMEIFSISSILLILKKTLFSSIFTLVLCIFISILFTNRQR